MAESVCFLVLGHSLSPSVCFRLLTLLHAKTLCCWGMLPPAGCTVVLQGHTFPIVDLNPSEQLQASSDIIHHVLLTHYGQDCAGPRLHLGKPCILDQVSGQAEAHGQGLQLQ